MDQRKKIIQENGSNPLPSSIGISHPAVFRKQSSEVSIVGDLNFDASKMFRQYHRNSADRETAMESDDTTATMSLLGAESNRSEPSPKPAEAGYLNSMKRHLSIESPIKDNLRKGSEHAVELLRDQSASSVSTSVKRQSRTVSADNGKDRKRSTSCTPAPNQSSRSSVAIPAQERQGSAATGSTNDARSSQRKRSSTTSAATTVNTTHQVLTNTSFFKSAPGNVNRGQVTIVTEEICMSEADLIPPLPQDASIVHSYNSSHIKACTTSFGLNSKQKILKTAEIVPEDGRTRTNSCQPTMYRPRKLTLTTASEGCRPGNRQRYSSIATFITSQQSSELVKQHEQRLRLDNLRVPRRWLSLRNVISFFNALILAIAITIVALVSYFAGISSTRSAIAAMSNVTINDLILKMDDMLGNSETYNVFTQTILSTNEYPVSNSVKSARHLYNVMSSASGNLDQIYAVMPDNTFLGVAIQRFSDNRIDRDRLQIRFLNSTTRPFRLIYKINSQCNYNQSYCFMAAFTNSAPLVGNQTYTIAERPFYQEALKKQRPGWSSVYLYSDRRTLGITTFRPVFNTRGTFLFLAAADVSLSTVSTYLNQISFLIAGSGSAIRPLLFIIEPQTGLLVASSDLTRIPIVNDQTNRILANQSQSPEVQLTLSVLSEDFPSLADIEWPADKSPLVREVENVYLIIGQYQRYENDIDWILVAYVPFATFTSGLMNVHYIQLPVVAIIVLITSVVCSILITRAIGRPLKRIAEQMLEVADLNFESDEEHQGTSTIIEVNEKELAQSSWRHRMGRLRRRLCQWVQPKENPFMNLKELQYLNSAMSAMKSGLKSFSKYVPLDIVTLLMKMKREAVLGVDDMELTIFFSDIVNFTTISESVPPQILVEIMSEYLSEMSSIILQSQGIVDKYIGDAVMAFWNAPIPLRDHATVACSVALKSQHRLADLRKKWMEKGYPEVKARIGVNTGRALVGNLGSTFRLNYTCLGDSVNLASRLEGLNKKYESSIIISENTKDRIHKDYFITRPLDVVAVKGKSHAVKVYELVGFRKLMSHETISFYSIYERAFNELCQGNFLNAIEGFKTFTRGLGMQKDPATVKHLAACYLYQANPPGSEWTYSTQLDEK